MTSVPRPPCPKCQTKMLLTRISSGVSGFDLETFECPACKHLHKALVAFVDPMTSAETSGWLQGQLQTPR
jgi:hypothetical protein